MIFLYRHFANSWQKESAAQKIILTGQVVYAGRNLEFIFTMESTISQRKAQIRANNGNRKKFIASLCVVAPVDKDYNAGKPKCGFIFPAFEDRSAEHGKIDIFFENPEHPDEGFLKKIYGR